MVDLSTQNQLKCNFLNSILKNHKLHIHFSENKMRKISLPFRYLQNKLSAINVESLTNPQQSSRMLVKLVPHFSINLNIQ